MNTLYITIDTEMDADKHWEKHSPREFTSVLDGIPNILRPIWDKYDVQPIYFVSPEVLENEKCCEVLRNELKKGAVIGAHLHSNYIEPEKCEGQGTAEDQFPCYFCSTQLEREKIKNLTQLIYEKIGVKPVWYRAARFGADYDTLQSIAELGYKYDSSFTPNIDWRSKGGPNHSKVPLNKYEIKELGIYEYPVTILKKRWGVLGRILPNNWLFYQWLRPTHMFLYELKHIIRYAKRQRMEDITMMFHSMEIMINKTPYVRNKFMQRYFLWRLEHTILYAQKCGYQTRIN